MTPTNGQLYDGAADKWINLAAATTVTLRKIAAQALHAREYGHAAALYREAVRRYPSHPPGDALAHFDIVNTLANADSCARLAWHNTHPHHRGINSVMQLDPLSGITTIEPLTWAPTRCTYGRPREQ